MTSKRTSGINKLPPWFLLLTGFTAGFFIAFLIRLTPGPVAVAELDKPPWKTASAKESAAPIFDFYTVLPESEVILASEPEVYAQMDPGVDIDPPDTEAPPPGEADSSAKEPRSATQKMVIGKNTAYKPDKTAEVALADASYLLQAGSFRNASDAERLKAQLVLSGQDVRVVKVTVGTGEMWYRVQLGPFHSGKEVDRGRKVLAERKIEGLLLKEK